MERKYFVICPLADTVCTYLQYIVNKWQKIVLPLLCVINNRCMAVQQLKSVSVFIKMSLTIFTMLTWYLLSSLLKLFWMFDRKSSNDSKQVAVLYMTLNLWSLPKIHIWYFRLKQNFLVVKITYSLFSNRCQPRAKQQFVCPPSHVNSVDHPCLPVWKSHNVLTVFMATFQWGNLFKKHLSSCYSQWATDVCCHFWLQRQKW